MTVNDLYGLTQGYMIEGSSSTFFNDFVIANTNRILGELFEENNMSRIFKGKAPFTEIPSVTSGTDVLPYEDEYCRNVMPLGLAAYLFMDDDMGRFSTYMTMYNNARTLYQRMVKL